VSPRHALHEDGSPALAEEAFAVTFLESDDA
jgi:hypothetical protein